MTRFVLRGSWSTPAKVRAGAVAAVVLACCLAAVIVVVFGGLGGTFAAIGGRDAPEVDAATGLYFSANDMDAQVANILLVGNDASLAADRAQDVAIYGSDRATADQDLQQATVTESGDAAAESELRLVLDRLGQYEALAAEAILTDQAAGAAASAAGRAPADSLAYYQQATDLMRTGILPEVNALTNVSASALDTGYQSGRSAAATGIATVAVTGAALLAVLVALAAVPVRPVPAAGESRRSRRPR